MLFFFFSNFYISRFDSFNEITFPLLTKCKLQDKLASQVAENWFTFLGEPFPTLLLSCIRKPIHELRCAALKLLLDLLKYCWAVRKFYETKGYVCFRKFLFVITVTNYANLLIY